MEKSQLLQKMRIFLKDIEKHRVGIVFHRDPDGLASGLMSYNLIKKLSEKKPDYFHSMEYNELDFIKKKLKEKKKEKIIFSKLSI